MSQTSMTSPHTRPSVFATLLVASWELTMRTLLVMGALCLHWRMDLCHNHAKHPSLQSKKPLLCKVHALHGCTMIVRTEHASAMLQKALMLLVRAGSIWYSMHAI
jgi:hypothetical protein